MNQESATPNQGDGMIRNEGVGGVGNDPGGLDEEEYIGSKAMDVSQINISF